MGCIDCLKDFYGDEYKDHKACMSEEQRYSKEGRAGWDAEKGQGNKGESRQKSRTSNLRAILAETQNIDNDVKNIVNTILDHENIPRKKPKFTNFVKNIMRNRANIYAIDKTWELFSQALKPTAVEMSQKKEEVKVESKTEEAVEEPKKSKKKKKKDKQKEKEVNGDENKNNKRKRDDTMEVDEDESDLKKTKFDWDDVITGLLKNKDGNEMKLNKLKKKCVNEFFSLNEGTHKSAEEVGAKFDKKLKKRKYRLLKDKVRLILDDDDEQQPEDKATPETRPKPVIAEPKPALSFNQWEASSLGSSAQTEKFRRLMGIKTDAPPQQAGQAKFGVAQRDDREIFRDLEQGFEKARQAHFGGRCFEQ